MPIQTSTKATKTQRRNAASPTGSQGNSSRVKKKRVRRVVP